MDNFYPTKSISENKCVLCDALCTMCNGNTVSDCLKCTIPSFLQLNKCVDENTCISN